MTLERQLAVRPVLTGRKTFLPHVLRSAEPVLNMMCQACGVVAFAPRLLRPSPPRRLAPRAAAAAHRAGEQAGTRGGPPAEHPPARPSAWRAGLLLASLAISSA